MNKKGIFTEAAEKSLQGSNGIEDFLDDKGMLEIPISEIKDNPYQPRLFFDEDKLEELKKSITTSGVIQPIIIREEEKQYILVAGERRLRAAKMAGLRTVPAIITDNDPIEISLIENIQRENLNPLEEANAYQKMIEVHKYTQKKLSDVLGKGRSTITETLSLLKLPEEIKKECRRADISKRALIEIVKIKSSNKQKKEFAKLINKESNSNDLRDKVRVSSKTKVDKILNKSESFRKWIEKINITDLPEESIYEFKNVMTLIKEIIENKIET